MSFRSHCSAAVLGAVLVSGCATCPCGAGQAASPSAAGAEPVGAAGPGEAPGTASGAGVETGPGAGEPSVLADAAAPVAGPGPAPALPEVVVEGVGMHVGGGSNDDAEKAPFKAAIELHFADFRRCYLHTEQPGKGGTFGVDLFIDRNGGKAEVRQPRTGMSGEKFRSCVVAVFSAIDFERPRAGPTVISYSLRFRVGGQ